MKIKLGDTVKGFEFDDGFVDSMLKYVGVKGKVTFIKDDWFVLQFPNEDRWSYPIDHKLAKPLSRLKYKLK